MPNFSPSFILQVQHPILNEDQPGNSVELILVDPIIHTKMQVTLSRAYDFLTVVIHGLNKSMSMQGDYLYLIPLNGGVHVKLYFGTTPRSQCANVCCKLKLLILCI